MNAAGGNQVFLPRLVAALGDNAVMIPKFSATGEESASEEALAGEGARSSSRRANGFGGLRLQPAGREGLRLAASILHENAVRWQPVGLGSAPGGRVALSTQGFSGIIDYWPQDLVARIGAGTSLDRAQELVRGEGLRVPATAFQARGRSLGGLFASGQRGWRSGPNRALRESVLGITVIDGAARVLKGGGRVMKNVAGYDLVRLHHGAQGAFGVIVDLVIKLEALPEAEASFAVPARADELVALLSSLRLPAAPVDPCVQMWLDEGACARAGFSEEGVLLLQVEGWKPAVEAWAKLVPSMARRVRIEEVLNRVDEGDDWRGRAQLGPSPMLLEGLPWARRWRTRGVSSTLVLDLQSGHSRVSLSGPEGEKAEVIGELAKLCQKAGGALFGEAAGGMVSPSRVGVLGPPEKFSRADATDAGASLELTAAMTPRTRLEERLKRAFDPEQLLPSPPQALEAIS